MTGLVLSGKTDAASRIWQLKVDEKGVKHRSISEIRGFDQRNEQ